MSASWSDQTQVVPSTRPPKHMPNTQQINYIGRVIERNTLVPIGGAKVSLDFQGTPSVVYTDVEGVYKFRIDLVGSNILEGQVWIEANGYKRYNRLIKLLNASTDLGDFRLEKTDDPAPKTNVLYSIPIPIKVAIITAVIGAIIVLVITKIILPTSTPTSTLSPSSSPLGGSSISDGALLKGSGRDVYMMQAGQRRWVPSTTFKCMGLDWNKVKTIPDPDLNFISLGPPLNYWKDGTLLKGSGLEYYRMQSCKRRWIRSREVFDRLRLDWDAVQTISDADLNAIPLGPDHD